MGFKFSEGLIMVILVIISSSMFSHTTMAYRWYFQQPTKQIVVGGSEKWHFGYNYSDWAIKNGPFHLYDTLVFKYDAPNATTFPHNVYQFPDLASFSNCDFKNAKMIANVTQGAGEGFKFVLNKCEPHYFGCAQHNGIHCINGTMKFAVTPTQYL